MKHFCVCHILRSSSCHFPNPLPETWFGLVTMLAASVSQLRLLLMASWVLLVSWKVSHLNSVTCLNWVHHLDASVILFRVYVFQLGSWRCCDFPAFLFGTDTAHSLFFLKLSFDFEVPYKNHYNHGMTPLFWSSIFPALDENNKNKSPWPPHPHPGFERR